MTTPQPDERDRLIAAVREKCDQFMVDFESRLRLDPLDERFPSSVLFLAPTHGNNSSPMAWVMTCDLVTGDWPNGKMQAYQLSRDLISVLAMLEADFQLGIPHLPELLNGHPLLRQANVVTELVEDGMRGGSDG